MNEKRQREVGKAVLVLLCAFCSLLAGATNAFGGLYGEDVEAETGISSIWVAVLTSAGQLGLYFTIPTGYIQDRFGLRVTGLGGALMCSAGWLIMSYCGKDTVYVMLLAMMMVGFGGGASFIAALSAGPSIVSERYTAFGIAVISSSMSLSVAFVVILIDVYDSVSGCAGDGCWREHFRLLAGICAVLMTPAPLFYGPHVVVAAPPSNPSVINSTSTSDVRQQLLESNGDKIDAAAPGDGRDSPATAGSDSSSTPRQARLISLHQSFVIVVKHGWFWIFFLSYFAGIASGLVILTQISDIVGKYCVADADVDSLAIVFSVMTWAGGIASGMISDRVKPLGVSRNVVLMYFFALQSALMLAVSIISSFDGDTGDGARWVFAAAITLLGLPFGATFTLIPAMVNETYGSSNFGKFFGYLQFASTFAAVLTPLVATAVFDASDSFSALFYAITCVLIASAFCLSEDYVEY